MRKRRSQQQIYGAFPFNASMRAMVGRICVNVSACNTRTQFKTQMMPCYFDDGAQFRQQIIIFDVPKHDFDVCLYVFLSAYMFFTTAYIFFTSIYMLFTFIPSKSTTQVQPGGGFLPDGV